MKTSPCSYSNTGHHTAKTFVHDVVSCTKFCSDYFARIEVRAKEIFPSNLNCGGKQLAKWDRNQKTRHWISHIGGLVKERHNSIANAMFALALSYIFLAWTHPYYIWMNNWIVSIFWATCLTASQTLQSTWPHLTLTLLCFLTTNKHTVQRKTQYVGL